MTKNEALDLYRSELIELNSELTQRYNTLEENDASYEDWKEFFEDSEFFSRMRKRLESLGVSMR